MKRRAQCGWSCGVLIERSGTKGNDRCTAAQPLAAALNHTINGDNRMDTFWAEYWPVIATGAGYLWKILVSLASIGVLGNLWYMRKSYLLQKAALGRPEPIFEVNNFEGYEGKDRMGWRVKIRNGHHVGMTLIRAEAKSGIFVDKDGVKHRRGIVRGQKADDGTVYAFSVSKEAIKKPVKVTFQWRWNDETAINETKKTIQCT